MLQELRIVLDSKNTEELADVLLDNGALSIGIEDAYADTNQEQALFGEPGEIFEDEKIQLWDTSLVLALFSEGIELETLARKILKDLCISEKSLQILELADQDWVKLTRSQFDAISISDRLWIVPSWREVGDSVEYVIRLDPGLAFGTGAHPTTYLCLSWLDKNISINQSVLDYGSGSGILSIVARKLGANPVFGVDIDEQSILASKINAQNNGLDVKFSLPKDFQPIQQFDVVLANILANPLKLLASMLASYVKTGGYIILSGILQSQQEEMISIYQEWFKMTLYQQQEGWICLQGIKK